MTVLITSDQTIAGFPAKKVRDFFKRTDSFNLRNIANFFYARHNLFSYTQAYWFIQLLKEEGYCEKPSDKQDDPVALGLRLNEIFSSEQIEILCQIFYTKTKKGLQLSAARAAPPIKRATASKALDKFLWRCRELFRGSHNKYLHQVKEAYLFGSLLHSDSPEVGDIDISLTLCATPFFFTPEGQQQVELECEEMMQRFWSGSRRADPTLKFLRGGNSYFSFIIDPAQQKLLFTRDKAPRKLIYSLEEGDLTITTPYRSKASKYWFRWGYFDRKDGVSSRLYDLDKSSQPAYEAGWNQYVPVEKPVRKTTRTTQIQYVVYSLALIPDGEISQSITLPWGIIYQIELFSTLRLPDLLKEPNVIAAEKLISDTSCSLNIFINDTLDEYKPYTQEDVTYTLNFTRKETAFSFMKELKDWWIKEAPSDINRGIYYGRNDDLEGQLRYWDFYEFKRGDYLSIKTTMLLLDSSSHPLEYYFS